MLGMSESIELQPLPDDWVSSLSVSVLSFTLTLLDDSQAQAQVVPDSPALPLACIWEVEMPRALGHRQQLIGTDFVQATSPCWWWARLGSARP